MNPYTIPGLKRKTKAEEILGKLKKFYGEADESKLKREAMWLLKQKGMKDSEIAEMFNCTRSWVFKQIKKQDGFIKVYPEVKKEMNQLLISVQ